MYQAFSWKGTSSTLAGLSAVQALYNLTGQILELHRLGNNIKSTFGQHGAGPVNTVVVHLLKTL